MPYSSPRPMMLHAIEVRFPVRHSTLHNARSPPRRMHARERRCCLSSLTFDVPVSSSGDSSRILCVKETITHGKCVASRLRQADVGVDHNVGLPLSHDASPQLAPSEMRIPASEAAPR